MAVESDKVSVGKTVGLSGLLSQVTSPKVKGEKSEG